MIDLRKNRPYFLVPFGDAALPGTADVIKDDIVKYAEQLGKPVTDVYVMSHGWHRNLFAAVAAYDRIMSRFSVLLARGRFTQTPSVAVTQDYCPLFVAIHWNSDPGDDRWVDKSGRRHKDSFLSNCREVFEIPPGGASMFLNDFENIFEFMTQISSSTLDSLDKDLDGLALDLTAKLAAYSLKYCPTGAAVSDDEKISSLWRCYVEAQNKAFLTDQQERAKTVGSFFNAVRTLAKFVIAAAGLAAVLNFFGLGSFVNTQWSIGWTALMGKVCGSGPYPLSQEVLVGIGLYLSALFVFGALLYAVWVRGYYRRNHEMRPQGSGVLTIIAWALPQILISVPILCGIFLTYLFRTGWVLLGLAVSIWTENPWWAIGASILFALISIGLSMSSVLPPGLFSERSGDRNYYWRDWMTKLARVPIRWFRDLVAEESPAMRLAEGIDNQLAFFEMQRKGTAIGKEVGGFVSGLMNGIHTSDRNKGCRIHFIGHSFGALVIANAARECLVNPGSSLPERTVVRNLCFVQPAMASNWFKGQDDWRRKVKGNISCVYSAYDTANGFWYPLANSGRLAAGYVGFCESRTAQTVDLGKGGIFSMLVSSPPLAQMIPPPPPPIVNIDASRLIYEGPVITGGGHDDIFKDDVLHLLWSATRL